MMGVGHYERKISRNWVEGNEVTYHTRLRLSELNLKNRWRQPGDWIIRWRIESPSYPRLNLKKIKWRKWSLRHTSKRFASANPICYMVQWTYLHIFDINFDPKQVVLLSSYLLHSKQRNLRVASEKKMKKKRVLRVCIVESITTLNIPFREHTTSHQLLPGDCPNVLDPNTRLSFGQDAVYSALSSRNHSLLSKYLWLFCINPSKSLVNLRTMLFPWSR